MIRLKLFSIYYKTIVESEFEMLLHTKIPKK